MNDERTSPDGSDGTTRKKLMLELSIPLLLVVAVNLAFARWVDNHPSFPLPRILGSSIATGKYLAFVEAARSFEQLDIAYTGLSPMMLVDAAAIDRSLAAPGYAPRGFNFAGPLQDVAFTTLLLDRIVAPLAEPSLVVHGMMPIDVITSHPRPERASFEILERPVFSMHVDGLRGRFREFLSTRIPLIQYREVIVERLRDPGPAKLDRWNSRARATDPWGRIELISVQQATGLGLHELNYKKKFRKFGQTLGASPTFGRTVEFARWCKREGMDFVLVNTPVHPLFFDLLPRGQEDYTRFVEKLHRTAEVAGVPVFDPLGAEPGPVDFFLDSHHFTAAGAEWFSAELAAFLREKNLPRPRD